MKKEITEQVAKDIWNQKKGIKYEYKTSDYFIKYGKNKTCSIHLQESGHIKYEPLDWIRNFLAIPVPIKIGKELFFVHKGFKDAFLELKEDLIPRIKNYETINITGFSHGSGIAPLLLLYLKLETDKNIESITLFGAPKPIALFYLPGYLKTKELCKDIQTIRIGKDIVSRSPFCWMGYGRVGEEITFKSKVEKKTILDKVLTPFLDHGEYYSYFSIK